MSEVQQLAYAGDVAVRDVWNVLSSDRDSILIDVRTRAEWQFIGVPDLGTIDKTTLLVEWQSFPLMQRNTDFETMLETALDPLGLNRDSGLYFLCRSGVRSAAAASALTQRGYSQCFNVTGGFEGPPDSNRHRGLVDGWKADSLPWHQT